MIQRESMEFDVVIVGAGPAGLSAAIRLMQLNPNVSVCVIEKGADIGAHTLSGAVIEPRALNELIPGWKNKNAPLHTPVSEDRFLFLTKKRAWKLPTPPSMQNHENYIISLGQFCKWLAAQAENLGVNIFPGFAATDILYENGVVCGIITGDKGVDKNGTPTEHYQPGMNLYAKQTLLAEGCRGSLTEMLFERFQLRKDCQPQTYGLGIKELWEIPEDQHIPGLVSHTIGWPLQSDTYGGSFSYHFDENKLAIGFVVGLDYKNPYLNPYEEFQRFKQHPSVSCMLKGGKRIRYGARALNEGGFQSIPELSFPGGLVMGCGAGFLNVPKIKGIHTAMKSGMLAAESIVSSLNNITRDHCKHFTKNIHQSWIGKELKQVRNIRPAMNWGLLPGLMYAALDNYILRGKTPWTFHYHNDYQQLKSAATSKRIDYPKHDNEVSFDLMSSVFLTQSVHEENQPCHLKLLNSQTPIETNLAIYDAPEQRYCPAGVYEIVQDTDKKPYLQINATNCIHCKACDIKDPTQNIVWTPPEGGCGPQYDIM